MPFKSEKQRRYLWKFHPDIARRWTLEEEFRKLVGATLEDSEVKKWKRKKSKSRLGARKWKST